MEFVSSPCDLVTVGDWLREWPRRQAGLVLVVQPDESWEAEEIEEPPRVSQKQI